MLLCEHGLLHQSTTGPPPRCQRGRTERSTFEAGEADSGIDSSPETHLGERRLTADTARAVAASASAVRERKVFLHQTFRLGTPTPSPGLYIIDVLACRGGVRFVAARSFPSQRFDPTTPTTYAHQNLTGTQMRFCPASHPVQMRSVNLDAMSCRDPSGSHHTRDPAHDTRPVCESPASICPLDTLLCGIDNRMNLYSSGYHRVSALVAQTCCHTRHGQTRARAPQASTRTTSSISQHTSHIQNRMLYHGTFGGGSISASGCSHFMSSVALGRRSG